MNPAPSVAFTKNVWAPASSPLYRYGLEQTRKGRPSSAQLKKTIRARVALNANVTSAFEGFGGCWSNSVAGGARGIRAGGSLLPSRVNATLSSLLSFTVVEGRATPPRGTTTCCAYRGAALPLNPTTTPFPLLPVTIADPRRIRTTTCLSWTTIPKTGSTVSTATGPTRIVFFPPERVVEHCSLPALKLSKTLALGATRTLLRPRRGRIEQYAPLFPRRTSNHTRPWDVALSLSPACSGKT